MYQTLIKLLKISAIYLIVALYFDTVLSHNRGTSQPFYFFLKPSYWFKFCDKEYNKPAKIRKASFNPGGDISSNRTINTALEEKNMIKMLEREKAECNGIRIVGLSKTYSTPKGICCCKSNANKGVQALRNIYLEVSKGELLGVMGHNGAGKTTLINVLSGFVSLTEGNARIYDSFLDKDLLQIRRKMGIVS
jgi:ATP-binding cassette subfamily A (ABC1) protein 5